MKQPKYKAVVYDVDGTAVDSRYNIDALQETCIELLGREATDEELLKMLFCILAVPKIRWNRLKNDGLKRS